METTMKTKKQVESTSIEDVAAEYQSITRDIKALKAKVEPLEAQLKTYANDHRELLNEKQQLKYANGTMVYLSIKQVLDGSDDAKILLAETLGDDFLKISVDEKQIIDACESDKSFLRKVTASGLKIATKETWSIKAN